MTVSACSPSTAGLRLRSGSVSGVRAFPALQRLAAQLDYSVEETNFTLGLTQLAGDIEHRSVIILFSDFSDTTSAELMLENVAQLLKRHIVLFVVFRDEELEGIAAGEARKRPRCQLFGDRGHVAEGAGLGNGAAAPAGR